MIKNITHKELKERGFNYKLTYGDCPVYERDGFGYMFKERGDTLEQIMSAYQNQVNPQHKPKGYLQKRLLKIEDGYEMGFNQLPTSFEFLDKLDQELAYKGTQLHIEREIIKEENQEVDL